jgi:hypothetical protein
MVDVTLKARFAISRAVMAAHLIRSFPRKRESRNGAKAAVKLC